MSSKSFKPLGVRGALLVFVVSLALGVLGGVLGVVLSDQPGVAGFAMTAAMLALVMAGWQTAWLLVVPVQGLGLLIERWFFFAQARHPQNLYYQVVS